MLRKVVKFCWIVLLLVHEGHGKSELGYVPSDCLRCICEVESGCRQIGCNDDSGSDSCGPYQIKSPYFTDAKQYADRNNYDDLGEWRRCTTIGFSCSKRAVNLYMRRYANKDRLGHQPTCEDFARIHNGGPDGYEENGTVRYWKKVSKSVSRKITNKLKI